MKKHLLFIIIIVATVFSQFSCSPMRAKCPAYARGGGGELYILDGKDAEGNPLPPERLKEESDKVLNQVSQYTRVKRNKKTGLVVESKKTKRGKYRRNNTKAHRHFKSEPGGYLGLDPLVLPPKKKKE